MPSCKFKSDHVATLVLLLALSRSSTFLDSGAHPGQKKMGGGGLEPV